MILVDANVLLYAVNEDSHHHRAARAWLDDALSGGRTVAFTWIVIVAFVRLATRDGLFPKPLAVEAALDQVDDWLGAYPAVILSPGSAHARILRELLSDSGTAGNLVNDAHLAALAIEHRCSIASFDRDFERFTGIERIEPAPT